MGVWVDDLWISIFLKLDNGRWAYRGRFRLIQAKQFDAHIFHVWNFKNRVFIGAFKLIQSITLGEGIAYMHKNALIVEQKPSLN